MPGREELRSVPGGKSEAGVLAAYCLESALPQQREVAQPDARVGDGEGQGLADLFVFEFWILAFEFCAVRLSCHCLNEGVLAFGNTTRNLSCISCSGITGWITLNAPAGRYVGF